MGFSPVRVKQLECEIRRSRSNTDDETPEIADGFEGSRQDRDRPHARAHPLAAPAPALTRAPTRPRGRTPCRPRCNHPMVCYEQRAGEPMIGRVYGIGVTLIVIGAVLYPLSWKRHRDSFPLSTYPMFAHAKREPILHSSYAYALDKDGDRHLLSPRFVGSEEVLQAQATLNHAARRGGVVARELCRRIAARVARSSRRSLSEATWVRIVSARHNAVHYLTGRDTVGKEVKRAQCAVVRPL